MSGTPEYELSRALYELSRRDHANNEVLRMAALAGALARTVLEFPPDDREEILGDIAVNIIRMVEMMEQRGVGGRWHSTSG